MIEETTNTTEPAVENTSISESDSGNERIGFGPRLGAYLIDIVINGVVGSVLGMVLGATLIGLFFGSEGGALAGGIGAMLGSVLGTVAGMFLMVIVMFLIEGATGQSLGKMILKLQNTNPDGTKAGAGALWTRALLKYSSTILTLIAGVTGVVIIGSIGSIAGLIIFIGCFFVLGEKRQAIHDLVAKTAVYKK